MSEAVVLVTDRDGPLRLWTATAYDGSWRIADVPGGRYRVKAQQWGFRKARLVTRLPYGPRQIPIDFVLVPEPYTDPTQVLGLVPVEGNWLGRR